MNCKNYLLMFACVSSAMLVGCYSESAIRDDLELSRSDAYRKWQVNREEEKNSQVYLKGELLLEDALKLGLKHNKSLLASLADREVSRGQVLESWSNALPSVTAKGGYTRLDSRGVPESVFLDQYSTGLEVVQPVFRGGQIPAALRGAKLLAVLADENIRGVAQGVIYDISKSYYDALLATRLYEVNKAAMESAEAQLRDTRLKEQEGVVAEFDILRAEVDVANFKALMIRYKNDAQLARAQLLKLMGVSQESPVKLSDILTYVPMKPVFEEAVELAYKNRPDIQISELNMRLQREAVRIARSEYFPTVNAFFKRNWARPDPVSPTVDDEWGNSWNAGASVQWNLFDGLGREGRMKQERATLEKRQVELVNAQEEALLQIEQAILTLRNAEELVDSQKTNVKKAQRGLKMVLDGYMAEVNTRVDVTEARSALTTAQGNYYQAIYSHQLARLGIMRAMGILGFSFNGPQPVAPSEDKAAPKTEVKSEDKAVVETVGKLSEPETIKTPSLQHDAQAEEMRIFVDKVVGEKDEDKVNTAPVK